MGFLRSNTVAVYVGVLLTLSVSGCATKSPANAAPTTVTPAAAELRARVEALIASGSESPEAWKGLGPAALSPVLEAARQTSRPVDQRARAVLALAWIADPAADPALEEMNNDGNAPNVLRGAAMRALALRQGVASVPKLKLQLASPQVELRSAAAAALGLVGNGTARQALEERLAEEENVGVREVLQQNLSKAQP